MERRAESEGEGRQGRQGNAGFVKKRMCTGKVLFKENLKRRTGGMKEQQERNKRTRSQLYKDKDVRGSRKRKCTKRKGETLQVDWKKKSKNVSRVSIHS